MKRNHDFSESEQDVLFRLAGEDPLEHPLDAGEATEDDPDDSDDDGGDDDEGEEEDSELGIAFAEV